MTDERITLRSTRPPYNTFTGLRSQFTPTLRSWIDAGWRVDVHARAVAIFEQRMGFEYSDEYEQSREWSDAMAEASESSEPVATTIPCGCSCHWLPGVMHVAACCAAPPAQSTDLDPG